MRQLNLIIPMVGQGKRFKNAGYTTYKPFIRIQDKPMVQYVLDAFPNTVNKIVITSEALLTNEQKCFLTDDLNCHIVYVPPHQNGPAYSIYLAKDQLPLDERFFIAYCDIFWTWNFESILQYLEHDGIVFTRTGFHPHLVNNNYSAFCKPSSKNSNTLNEIREKSSFTNDHLSEPLSIGAFYIKNGHVMMQAIEEMIQLNRRVSQEFFPSLIFNTLVKSNKSVYLCETDFFIHWGVPEQLDDFLRWQAILSNTTSSEPGTMKISHNIMMMGGSGSRMKTISDTPKALLNIYNKPLYQFIQEKFDADSTTLIISPALQTQVDSRSATALYPLAKQTCSQYDTIMMAKHLLTQHQNYFLTSCDAYGIFNMKDFICFTETKVPDAIIFTFQPSLLQSKLSHQHTHVSVHDHAVTAIHFKSKSSRKDQGLAGFFWVRDGDIFSTLPPASTISTELELSADHAFERLIEQGYKILHYPLDQYVHLGTPEEYQESLFWQKYHPTFSHNTS